MGFLDEMKAEWCMNADALVAEAAGFADELGVVDYKPHNSKEYEAREKAAHEARGQHPSLSAQFVNGFYSAKNSYTAQGHGKPARSKTPTHYSVGSNFGPNPTNSGPCGPSFC